MLKKVTIVFGVLFLCALVFWGSFTIVKRVDRKPQTQLAQPATPTPAPELADIKKKTVFIPYWTDISKHTSFSGYDRLVYFGLAADQSGIIKSDPGYVKLQSVLSVLQANEQELLLAVRFTDSEKNIELLNNTAAWEQVAASISASITEYGFDGAAIDFELSAIPTEGLRTRITDFTTLIATQLHQGNYPVSIVLYGDLFYRKRPYDIEKIAGAYDEVMVMAYDFHKAGGEPGPNFPIGGKDIYNYDFPTMLRDYLLFVPPEKLTVLFGMYGYDWIVDEKKRPIKPAKSLTLHQIREKFLDSCVEDHCIVRRDEEAGESEVNYIDRVLNYHIVWFEDTVSVSKKLRLLQEQGITSVGYWAWGYF